MIDRLRKMRRVHLLLNVGKERTVEIYKKYIKSIFIFHHQVRIGGEGREDSLGETHQFVEKLIIFFWFQLQRQLWSLKVIFLTFYE